MSEDLPPIAYAVAPSLPPVRWGRAAAVPGLCMLAAWLVGAFTNGVSGVVSRAYFDAIVGWMYGGRMSWGEVIFQGLLESTAFGVLLAFAFTLVFVLATGCRATLRDAAVALAAGIIVCLALWLVGGLAGIAWTTLSPVSFRNAFRVVAPTQADLVRWGFVGGSLWGAYFGGLAAILTASIVAHVRYRSGIDRLVVARASDA